MHSLTWLHLSDLHLCEPKTGLDAEEVLEKLLDDLNHMETEHNLQPDLIFFTGDMAYGELGNEKGMRLEDQYDAFNEFIEKIRKAFKVEIPKENVFLVPGNHDVDRTVVTDQLTDWLANQDDHQKIYDLIKDNGQPWKDYMRRLTPYRRFLEQYGFTHLLTDPDRLVYAEKRKINGINFGIAGFNSAWSCSKPSAYEKGNLWMGAKWQLSSIRSKLKHTDFNIALIHHPSNWFVEFEDRNFQTKIQETFKFFLHGHEHFEWVQQLEDGHTTISADACYDRSDGKNGYNFVRIDFLKNIGEVWLREYKSAGAGGWIANNVPSKTGGNGVWSLTNTEWMRKIHVVSYGKRNDANPENESNLTLILKSHQNVILSLEVDVNKLNQKGLNNVQQIILQTLQIDENNISLNKYKRGDGTLSIKLPAEKADELEEQFIRKSEGIKQLEKDFALTNIEKQDFDILLIDESPIWQEIVSETFKSVHSYDVASSCEEVVGKLKNHNYRVVCLTTMSYSRMRNILSFLIEEFNNLPVILISATEEENNYIKERYHNIKKVISKSQNHFIDELESCIYELIDQDEVVAIEYTEKEKIRDQNDKVKKESLKAHSKKMFDSVEKEFISRGNNEEDKVFINYAPEDYEVAKRLYDDLKEAGHRPWINEEDLLPGQRLDTAVLKALRESSHFIFLISKHSVSGEGQIQTQLKMALRQIEKLPSNKIFIIPVRLDGTELVDEQLRDLHAVYLSDYENGFEKILKAIESSQCD